MRKYIVYFITFFLLLSVHIVNAYSSNDVAAANALASSSIIVDHSNDVTAYRLDESISRQEVVGIAIKMLGVTLPNDYICQGYFSDAYFPVGHSDIWVCRSVEMAADNDLVSRDNTIFRPKDNITRAEALAIIIKAKDLTYPKNISQTFDGQPTSGIYPSSAPQWHIDLIEGAKQLGILSFETHENAYDVFAPNRLATRADVFAYAQDVITNKAPENAEIAGTFTYKTSNTVTYLGPKEDFEITMPEDYTLYEEEMEYDSFLQNIYTARIGKDDIILTTLLVGNEPCVVCNTTELESLEEGVAFGSGTIKQKISDTLYIIDGKNEYTTTQAYIKYSFNTKTKTLYYAIATTTTEDWMTYKKELLTMVNSLKVYK